VVGCVSCVSDSEIVVLIEELKRAGVYINRNAVEVVTKRVDNGSLRYIVVLRSARVVVEVSSNGIYCEVIDGNNRLVSYCQSLGG